MTNVTPLNPHARQKARRRKAAQGKTLCRSGFHKWAPDSETPFDTRGGRLVTVQRCERCGERRNTLT